MIYYIIRSFKFQMSVSELLGNITLIGFFVGMKNQFNWYLALLAVTYIMTPFWYSLKSKNAKCIVWIWVILVGITSFGTDFLLISSRLPVF